MGIMLDLVLAIVWVLLWVVRTLEVGNNFFGSVITRASDVLAVTLVSFVGGPSSHHLPFRLGESCCHFLHVGWKCHPEGVSFEFLQIFLVVRAAEGLVDRSVDQAEEGLLCNGLPVAVDEPWGLGALVEFCFQCLVPLVG